MGEEQVGKGRRSQTTELAIKQSRPGKASGTARPEPTEADAHSMALHFNRQEFALRRGGALAAMAARGLDALLLFKQERCVSWAFVAVPA